ncbi:hypothetical protein [Alicyclobacillus sp. ALC3]|uniref:hypothetical protein n=1 Tax=Alicyclobacillus sp. ALC3 TaxID=2796143 RepID=UPI002379ACCF|nr:hypothetical protein [Alicyclobacillus sp. ALC3]WDL96617.1 hypothetical protein JC200_20270 [Alicyclobacillus sp. ALC3]
MVKGQSNTSETRFSIVTHCFWRYPIVGLLVVAVVMVLGFAVGSPDWPQATIKKVSAMQPGGAIWAVAQELDGTSASYTNTHEYGMSDPAKRLVIDPLKSASWALSPNEQIALHQFLAANISQQTKWAMNYDKAIQKTVGTNGMGGGGMGTTPVPSMTKIESLTGNFGPVPVMAQSILKLAQNGYLETYFQGISPSNVYQYTNIWLYDQPYLLNTAIQNGLTDDQWGMIKERGFFVGPWYLIVPAIAHVELPGGSTGLGFIFWNGLIALFFVVLFPLVPGFRSIPKYLRLYKLVYAVNPVEVENYKANVPSSGVTQDAAKI